MDKYRPDRTLDEHLMLDPDFWAGIAQAAKPAQEMAAMLARQAGSPWMPRRGADTIVLDVSTDGVRLVNTDHGGHLMEWGSRNNPPHAPLRRGVRAAGLHLINE